MILGEDPKHVSQLDTILSLSLSLCLSPSLRLSLSLVLDLASILVSALVLVHSSGTHPCSRNLEELQLDCTHMFDRHHGNTINIHGRPCSNDMGCGFSSVELISKSK